MQNFYTECIRKSFTNLKAYINLLRGHVQVLNCHNVAKYSQFYLWDIYGSM
jgi:hypothetical protein